jgi:hypothetical protein
MDYDDWFSIVLDQEAAEQISEHIVDDIIKRSQDVIFEKQIERQVLPYAVNFSKDLLSSLINVKNMNLSDLVGIL